MGVSFVASIYLLVAFLFVLATSTLEGLLMAWHPTNGIKFFRFFVYETIPNLFIKWSIPLAILSYFLGNNKNIQKYALYLISLLGFGNGGIWFVYYIFLGKGNLFRDAYYNLPAEMWLYDSICLCIAVSFIVIVESNRYFEGFFRTLGFLLGVWLFGVDAMLPIFFVMVGAAESSPYIHRNKWGDVGWLYLVVMVLGVCIWANKYLQFCVLHNSVADMMWMALNTPASRRTVFSLLLTYAASMIWMLPQTSYEDSNDPNVNVVMTWVFRILLSILTSWHVGAGVSVFFLVRELTPNRTFKTVFKLKAT